MARYSKSLTNPCLTLEKVLESLDDIYKKFDTNIGDCEDGGRLGSCLDTKICVGAGVEKTVESQ